ASRTLSGKSNEPTEMTLPGRPTGPAAGDEALPLEDVQAASAAASPRQAARSIVPGFIRTPAAAARATTASPVRRAASRWPAGTAAPPTRRVRLTCPLRLGPRSGPLQGRQGRQGWARRQRGPRRQRT